MVNNKIVVIFGGHGAGKSTLARQLLQADGGNFTENSCEFGKYTVSSNGNVVAVGKYSIACGGADSLSKTAFYYDMLEHLLKKFDNKLIVFEGIFVSTLHKTPLNEFLKYKYEYGVEVILIFLYADYKTSYIRVLQRSGKEPKAKNIKHKIDAVNSNFNKYKELKMFPYTIINTINKNQTEVFNEAKNFIGQFWDSSNT